MTNGIIDSGQEIVTNGLVLHLDAAQRRSYSGTGTTWTDLSGNGNNGTLTNGPTFNPANGGSIQFDGTNDYVNVSNQFMANFTAFTYEAFVRIGVNNSGGNIMTYSASSLHTGPQFYWTNTELGLVHYNGGENRFLYSYKGGLSINKDLYYHVVATWTNGVINLYINGEKQTGLITSSLGASITNVYNDATVSYKVGVHRTDQAFYKGDIAVARVYNRVLSDAEVLQNYNATKARFEVPALLDLHPNAAAAYSLRKLRSGYTGSAIRVRRSSDNTEQDIGFTSTGDLDTTALTTFVGANNGFVTTWYDQSGTNNNAVQTTQANQPQIISNGTIFYRNSKPIITFNGTSTWFNTTLNNPFSFTGGLSLIHLSYKNATTFKFYETILSAGTTGNTALNVEKTIGLGYSNNSSANPIPTISTDIWQPSGIQYNGRVNLNSTHLVGYYISNWSLHRDTGSSIITFNGNNIPTKTYNTFVPQGLNTNPIKIGVYDTILTQSFFAGEIQEIIAYSSNQSPNRIGIETNINSYYGIYNSNIDSDAQSFITAAAITDSTQQGAVDALVKDLKNYGLWTKMKAIYPFVGGTAASHKFNLKDPRDVDGAFRLVFNGGWTHSATGALPNGTTGYANTFLNDLTVMSNSSNSLGFYSRTNNNQTNSNDIGSYDGTYFTGLRYNNNNTQSFAHNGTDGAVGSVLLFTSNLSSAAFLTQSRINLNSLKFIRNGVVLASTTATKTGVNSNGFYFIGATRGSSNIPQQFTNREFAFTYFSDGLTDTEAVNLYTAVQKYQTTLGRQV